MNNVGMYIDDRQRGPTGELKTVEVQVLMGIKKLIRAEQVTKLHLEGVPALIIERALKEEHKLN